MLKNQKKGFTLIELLVVIAIIALLAAILFPVFARARENARRSSCQSNLKQIGLGFAQYTQDYDEFYPTFNSGNRGPGTPATELGWAVVIQPYLKSTQIYQCPSEPSAADDDPGRHTSSTPKRGYNDYWMNRWMSALTVSGSQTLLAVPLSVVSFPSHTYLLGDGNGYETGCTAYTNSAGTDTSCAFHDYGDNSPATSCAFGSSISMLTNSGSNTFSVNQQYAERHFDGLNVAFVDGHVKWLKAQTMNNERNKWPDDTTTSFFKVARNGASTSSPSTPR